MPTYFVIRHKATGKLMPQLVGRGYSSWHPAHPDPKEVWNDGLTPRLFNSKRAATTSVVNWERGMYVMHRDSGDWPVREPEETLEIIPQPHRRKGDLEILEVELKFVGQMELPL
jgi:hypothetical protein